MVSQLKGVLEKCIGSIFGQLKFVVVGQAEHTTTLQRKLEKILHLNDLLNTVISLFSIYNSYCSTVDTNL